MNAATLNELIDALENGKQLILPQAHAADELRAAFNTAQQHRGRAAWDPPHVLTWAQWIKTLWSTLAIEGVDHRLLLNPAQEHSLWYEVLKSIENQSLGSVEALADMAMNAWQLAASYRASHRLREFASTHDARLFAEWTAQFVQRCALRGYLSSALLEDALLHHLQAGSVTSTDSLTLVGFDERLPAQDALLHGFQDRGTRIVDLCLKAPDAIRAPALQAQVHTEQAEHDLAARWTRERLERSSIEIGPPSRVALLVPNLQKDRAILEEVFRETLAQELQWIGTDLCSSPWEIPAGLPLASIPIVADALSIVQWSQASLPVARVSSLLLSPYVGENGTASEFLDASAYFDTATLRRLPMLHPEIAIDSLVSAMDSGSHTPSASTAITALGWVRGVKRLAQSLLDRTQLRTFAAWMDFVRSLLQAANWPGTMPLNATEFETNRSWESLLDMIATLDFSGRHVTFSEALQALTAHATKIRITPPTADAPVQILNIAEAEGCVFDGLIFLHCTDANWPISERVNPLLPWSLQRLLGMPGTDAARSHAQSRAYTESLIRRSRSVLFLHAATNDHAKLRPSPLLEELKIMHSDPNHLVKATQHPITLDFEDYSESDDLPPLPSDHVRGGSAVLKLQSSCGFLAFAQMRLLSTEPALRDLGFDAFESGKLLHQTMQLFWKQLRSQEALRRLTPVERQSLLRSAIDDAFTEYLHPRNGWDHAYLQVQKERLCSLLQHWLDEELRRSPFDILDLERKQTLPIGPLMLDLRMDRIDRVGDGFVFVDYKTSYTADPKQWEGQRPDDPQLPLYALLCEPNELKGLAFAKIRPGRDLQWLGYQAEEGIFPKAKVQDLPTMIDAWRNTLTQLASDFATGKADVSPKNYTLNCSHCAQRILCRVDPNALQLQSLDDQENAEFADG
ncbi:MAG: hypothetical protein HIU91_00300 [Acidobacteria bacterium]|nr:hypothetical protein [Acidobacteriota bacterium]